MAFQVDAFHKWMKANKMKMNDSPHKDAYQISQQGALPTLYNYDVLQIII